MKLIILITIGFLAFANHIYGQQKKTDLTVMNLSGKVKSLTEKQYNPAIKSGEIEKAELSIIRTYYFSETGLKKEEAEESENIPGEKNIDKILYKYDNMDRLIEQDKMKNESPSGKEIYKYDNKGNLIEKDIYDFEGKISNKVIFKNNGIGQKLTESQYYSNGNLCCTDNYKYDSNGNMIEKSSIGGLLSKIIFKYDNKNRMVENNTYLNGKFSSKFTVKYDNYNNIIEQLNYDENGRVYMKRVNKYEFDKNQNWTKNIEYYNDQPSYIAEREIIYY